jgi:tetratricopeptide (TPR) repeat protein
LSYDVLAWAPDHRTSWLLIGYLYVSRSEQATGSGDLVLIATSIDDHRRAELLNAVQALQLASASDEDQSVVSESCRLLSLCYLELGQPASAVDYALAVTKMDERSAASWANLSAAHLANGAFADAADAATKALELDKLDPVAQQTIASLQRVLQDLRQ